MKTQIDNATLKIWFHSGISRNITNVVEINHEGSLMSITQANRNVILINFDKVTMIEPVR